MKAIQGAYSVALASCPCLVGFLRIGKMPMPRVVLIAVSALVGIGSLCAEDKVLAPVLPENVEVFTVKTRSDENKEVPFYVRRPAGYEAKGRTYRVLFICPVFNGDGLKVLTAHSLIPLADSRGWFVVSPTFKQQTAEVRDRKKSYYYPEAFSGKAVIEALDLIAKKYPVDTNRLLLAGLSGGAQFVHRFALWSPERVTAVAINSSSWFDDPNPKAAGSAWLVTIGESDPSYDNSLEFVSNLNDCGAAPLFRAYLGMIHEGDGRVSKLNAAFLSFYDELTSGDLGKRAGLADRLKPKLALAGKDMPYVGDGQVWKFLPNTGENREKIAEDNRIFLPSEEIAKLWGKQEDE